MSPSVINLVLLVFAFVLHAEAFPPHDISNFQNEFVCDTDVRLVRPRAVSDVEEAVKRHSRVRAVGGGFSWSRLLCAPSPDSTPEEGDSSANIMMTTVRPLIIDVNEEEMSVWVSAGVVIWDLMNYLGNYNTPSSPRGYALGSTPALVNQTIAGAIATNTHGTSLTYGSISNQVIGFKVVLANGTTTEIYPDNYPLYFRAFQVNVGRLGVVTDVKMRIIRETLVTRTTLLGVPQEEVIGMLKSAEEFFRTTGFLPDWLDGTWLNWNPLDSTFMVFNTREQDTQFYPEVDFEDIFEESQDILDYWLSDRINAPLNVSRTEGGLDIADGVSWEVPEPFPPNPFFADVNNMPAFVAQIETIFSSPTNISLETHLASLSNFMPDVEADRFMLRDGYEVSFPVENMAECIEGAIEVMESQLPDPGIRVHAFFRLVGQESGLLSVSNDQPRVWMSLDDFVYYNQGRQSNVPFKNLMAYLVTTPFCAPARLHWGKPAFPDPGCWNGAVDYPETWCDFGCAVRDLDPTDKFISDFPEMWNWEGADLDRCCTPDGYDKSLYGCDCAVIRPRSPDECPEAPFYTNR